MASVDELNKAYEQSTATADTNVNTALTGADTTAPVTADTTGTTAAVTSTPTATAETDTANTADSSKLTKIAAPTEYSNSDYADMLNTMYDAQYEAGVAELENAYNESLAEYNRTAEKLPQTYNTQRNSLSANYEKAKRNYNLMAAASGINTGTASQAQLSQLNQYQNNMAALATAQADAQAEIDYQIAALKRQKQYEVAALLNSNNLERANAAISAWQDGRTQLQTQADVLAQYGDFSLFTQLGYTPEQVTALENAWVYNNQELAKQLYPELYNRVFGVTTDTTGGGDASDNWNKSTLGGDVLNPETGWTWGQVKEKFQDNPEILQAAFDETFRR